MKATEPHRASAAGSILPSMTSWIVAVESVCGALPRRSSALGRTGTRPEEQRYAQCGQIALKMRTENGMAETSILGTVDRWARA